MNIVIKFFSTPNGNYIYDRETNSILSVNEDEFEALKRIVEKKALDNDFKLLKIFQERGFCKESSLRNIEHSQNKFMHFHLENKVEKLTLQVTQNCNLRCTYCSYSGMYNQRSHSNNIMSYDMMKKSVDFLIKHSIHSKKVDLGFYGGEPLLAFDKIKKLIIYIKQKYPYKELTYSLTTNGTIFTDEIIQFLSENEFNVMVSIDGPKELHDKNRVFSNGEGSFDKMMKNLLYIKQKMPEFFSKISFNTVVAPGHDYKCVSDFFDANEVIEDGMLSVSTLSDFNNKEDIQYDELYFITYRIQRTKMLLSALGLISKDQVSKLFSQEMAGIYRFHDDLGKISHLPSVAHPSGPCIPGSRRPMVDVIGNLYPCERVSEASVGMQIGSIDSGFDLNKARTILNIGKLTEDECLNCWNFFHCGMCAAAADNTEKFSKKEKLSRCMGTMSNTLVMFKTICLLKENNFNFERKGLYE